MSKTPIKSNLSQVLPKELVKLAKKKKIKVVIFSMPKMLMPKQIDWPEKLLMPKD